MQSHATPGELRDYVLTVIHANTSRGGKLCVGLSGGRDSVVLLHALASLGAALDRQLSAIHVNHQISPHADSWAEFCAQLCARLAVPLQIERVTVARHTGKGIEASARDARYKIFHNVDAGAVLLAHHLDDQAETILLQALRGAGLRGIRGMPLVRKTDQTNQPKILRPLLDVPREILIQYAKVNNLQWIEDESNADTHYTRNFLRHDVVPHLEKRMPHYRHSLSRLASHASEAQLLIDELAEFDLQAARTTNGLRLATLRALTLPRLKNALRYHLIGCGLSTPTSRQLEEIVDQLLRHDSDSKTKVRWGDAMLYCHRDTIYFEVATQPIAETFHHIWRGEKNISLGNGLGCLSFEAAVGEGVSQQKLTSADVTIRSRRGGERFQPNPKRPRRTLKNLLHEAGVPVWERARLPLIFCGEQLVWVPEIGVEYGFAADEGEPGWTITWRPNGGDAISAAPATPK